MAQVHFTPEQLRETFSFSGQVRNIVFGLIGVGLVLVLIGSFIAMNGDNSHAGETDTHEHHEHDSHATEDHHSDAGHADEDATILVADDHGEEEHGGGHHHEPTWVTRVISGFLMHNTYFITLAMGALFFLAVHRVGNSGWHTAIQRVPEAMFSWLPFAAIGAGIMLFLMDDVYEWLILQPGEDALIDAKRAYLNKPFFAIRAAVFFGVWILVATLLRRWSVNEDKEGGLANFNRALPVSAVFIVFFAISYSLFAVDWLKSLEPHWFSTIFGVYVFAGSMASAMATMTLITYFLKKQGYMKYVNDSHFQDINTYMLGFSIFWAYIWVSQFLLIWYSNIPEETIYFYKRYSVGDPGYLGYAPSFYANLFLCFVLPFLIMLRRDARRNPKLFIPVAAIVLIGHWNDLFQMIMPGTMFEKGTIGLLEIGFFALFAGLFLLVVFRSLSKANLVPLNHPYLEESVSHTTGDV